MLQAPAVLSLVALAAAASPAPAAAVSPARGAEAAPAAGQGPPAEPRVVAVDPRDEAAWTADVRAGIAGFGVDPAEATPLLRTLARHPPALHGLGPLAAYLRSRSMVAAVDQIDRKSVV